MVLVQTIIGRPFKTIIPIKFKQGILLCIYKYTESFVIDVDDQQYLHIYEEQLERRGSLKVNIIQCLTVGPPTVGKKTLKEQLLANNGENTATVEGEHNQPPSSSVHEEVKRIQVILNDRKSKQSHCTVAVDKYNWKSLTFDEEVIGFLKNMSKSRGEYFTREEVLIWAMCYICLGISLLSFANVIRIENAFKFSLSNLAFTWTYSGLTVSMLMFGFLKCTKSSTTDIIAIAKEALLHNDIDEVQALFDFTIYLRDSGGQPEFHEVLPALVSQSTLFLLVFNLSEGLDTQYEVTYKTSNGEVSDPYVSSFTVKQALLQCLASISSLGRYSKPQTNRLKSLFIWLWKKLTQLWKKKVKAIVSKVIIIGTHKDLLGDTVEADDVICQMNNQLKDELKGTDWYSKDMVIPVEGRKLLLGLNTYSPKDIRKVKDLVNKVALNGDYQLEIPIPWLSFELCIRKLERKVMSLKECQHLANDCEIFAGGEFNAALWFLHNKVGTIRYFKDVPELQNVVITDPQLLFDLVTDLVVNTFSFGKNIEKMSEHDRFRSSGRFTKHHLEQCEAVKEKLLSVEQVIAVLEHLVIIAAVGRNESNEQEYFLPCVLVHASFPSSPLLHNDSDIPPLLIIFNCHYTPRGIFSLLIAKILLDGKNKWELCSEEIKRNQVDFCLVKSGHIVTITNLFAFLEIAVKSPCHATERSLENVYVVIKHYISRCLNDVRKQFNYSSIADHSFGFYCKKFHNQSADHHPAICNDSIKPTYTRCHLKCKFTSYLLPQHHLWFYKKCELN